MKIPKAIILLLLLVCNSNSLQSQDTFKTMFYNLLNFPLQEPADERLNHLEYILNDYQPDIFMVCELNNINGANSIINRIQQNINPNFVMANFVLNTSDDNFGNQNDLQNLMYYDNSKFTLEYQTVVPTIYRDFNRYVLRLNTPDQFTNPIYLEIFVCHLKATQDDSALRLQMVNDLESYLNNPTNNFDSNSYVILAGDFNVYTGSEPGFQELLDTSNTVTFIDPANRVGSWHTNSSYLDVFTQSTRTSSGLGGATGGFDDRFDFIMTSESLQTNATLSFIPGTYQSYGNNNNSNCFNQEINSTNCSGSDFSFDLRNALYNFSDHLPVTLEFQTNQSLYTEEYYITNPISFSNGNVLRNSLSLNVNINLIDLKNLNIYNTLGQKIKSIAITGSSIINEDISHLSNGVYFIIAENQSVKPLKFIKN